MGRVFEVFYANTVVCIVVVAALAAVCAFVGLSSVAAFLFMLLGIMIVLYDAHTDPHIPEAPTF